MDYTGLGWDGTLTRSDVETPGAVWFDIDGDGSWGRADYTVWGIRGFWEDEERLTFSPPLTDALVAAGIQVPNLFDPDQVRTFWDERYAAKQAAAAVANWPDLPFMVMGTEVDHVAGAPDHAHITGLAGALVRAGARWVRVNPDAVYQASFIDPAFIYDENPANVAWEPGDAASLILDEVRTGHLQSETVSAGMAELMERVAADDWAEDLDGRAGG